MHGQVVRSTGVDELAEPFMRRIAPAQNRAAYHDVLARAQVPDG
jgi:hypothetical protein